MPQSGMGLERTLSNTSTGTIRNSSSNNGGYPGDYGHAGEDSHHNASAGRHSEMNGNNSINGRGLGGRPMEMGEAGNSIRRERDARPVPSYASQAQSSPSPFRPAPPSGQRNNPLMPNTSSNNGNNSYTERPRRTDSPGGYDQGSQGEEIPWGGPFPSLHLWPLNETFTTKMIHLPPITGRNPAERVKIGRQTNIKSTPTERNGFFDSKVLSRMHAEVWSEQSADGSARMYIRDVKSSNGTFVNNDRLSNEGMESEPYELKSEDIVEFGIDIVSEDNKTVQHYKVSAKAYVVWNVDDAGLSARELANYFPYDQAKAIGPTRKGTGAAPPMNGSLPMGMMSAGGKGIGLNFDHVLAKLQAELEKSKETGAELQNLTSAMTDIQDTLSGGLPPNENGHATKHIPPQFQPHEPKPVYVPGVPDHVVGDPTATIAALQAQLSSTQSILVSHKDRIRSLETLLTDHEAIKTEVLSLRQQMEASKLEFETILQNQAQSRSREEDEDDHNSDGQDSKQGHHSRGSDHNGDAASPSSRRSSFMNRSSSNQSLSSGDSKEKTWREEVVARNNMLASRIDSLSEDLEQALELSRTLSADLEQALKLSRNLQQQHDEASSTVKALEDKIVALERDMATRVTEAAGQAGRSAEDRWETWRSKFEEGWRKEREGYELERERLRGVVREWEEASRRAQEEEEERLMNARLSGESGTDDDSGEEEENDLSGKGSDDDWIGSGLDRGKDESMLMRIPDRSHSVSPRSSSFKQEQVRIRRESSSRLDPAIRALKAAAGEPATRGPNGPKGNGTSTPRTGSSSAAEGALDALRAKAARNRRAGTITGRKRGESRRKSSGMEKGSTRKASLAAPDAAPAASTLGVDIDGDDDSRTTSHGESTCTESDETAHEGPKSESERSDKDKHKVKVAEARTNAGESPNGIAATRLVPVAVSVAVVGVVAWAYLNRLKD